MSVALLIGDRHGGKTTVCRRLAELTRARGLSVGGIIAPAVYERGNCAGYDVVDLATGGSARLASVDDPGAAQVGPFHFLPEGLALGKAALAQAAALPHDLVIVDEVGPLELAGGGWSGQLDELAGRQGFTLFVVRRPLVSQVAERCGGGLPPAEGVGTPALFDLAGGSEVVIDAIMKRIGPPHTQNLRP